MYQNQVRKTLRLEHHYDVVDDVTTTRYKETEAVHSQSGIFISSRVERRIMYLRRTVIMTTPAPRNKSSALRLVPTLARQPQNAPLRRAPHHRSFTKRPCLRHACAAAARKIDHLANFALLVAICFFCVVYFRKKQKPAVARDTQRTSDLR